MVLRDIRNVFTGYFVKMSTMATPALTEISLLRALAGPLWAVISRRKGHSQFTWHLNRTPVPSPRNTVSAPITISTPNQYSGRASLSYVHRCLPPRIVMASAERFISDTLFSIPPTTRPDTLGFIYIMQCRSSPSKLAFLYLTLYRQPKVCYLHKSFVFLYLVLYRITRSIF